MGVRPSTGSVGDAYDNAMAASFFASLECEIIDHRVWKAFAQARMEIFTWIDGWYNPRRRHSGLHQKSPMNFEREHAKRSAGPSCSHVKQETMPTDACQFFYECEDYKIVLRPISGDCCVFCSFGSVKCPPVQAVRACCGR